jgi:S-DNA-T family DNA segregation ATPase FtsK/SpoIIIE
MPPEPPYEQPASASDDEYYDRAVDIVLSERRASRGYLQRRLGIGYMLAADLIERMERDRVIGPPAYNGHRLILATDPRVSSAPW